MSDYETDRQFELKFIRSVRQILADRFIVRDFVEDTERGTDFFIMSVEPFRVAVRLRRINPYFEICRNQFTIRYSRPSGIKTEIHKIREGLVRYILYGFVDIKEEKIVEYFIGDLDVFREKEKDVKFEVYPNVAGDSKLAVYDLNSFPPNFVVERRMYMNPETERMMIEDYGWRRLSENLERF